MTQRPTQTEAFWSGDFEITPADIDLLNSLFVDSEQPQALKELARVVVERRADEEEKAIQKRLLSGGNVYRPTQMYATGQRLVFSAEDYRSGEVVATRVGRNPDDGEFTVMTVKFEGNTQRDYACGIRGHALENARELMIESDTPILPPEALVERYDDVILPQLEAALRASGEFVRLAGKWFPTGLLADVEAFHLNLAEARLDMDGGGPLSPEILVEDLDLPSNINKNLQVFSLNYALQEDERFDEVGPAGKVLWHLRRYEPDAVTNVPVWLQLQASDQPIDLELPEELAVLAAALDDEFGEDYGQGDPTVSEVEVLLTFPHARAGTLPLTARLAPMFPTAYAAPRIRFELVDHYTKEKVPGWVVRAGRYVWGLDAWYAKYKVQPGSLVYVRPGQKPGEVVIQIARQRPKREWVRTATADGAELRLTTNQQAMEAVYEEESVAVVNQLEDLDALWRVYRTKPLDAVVRHVFNEQAKLNLQNRVHAKSLYTAVNLVRRCTPEMVFAALLRTPHYEHIGDAYWRVKLD